MKTKVMISIIFFIIMNLLYLSGYCSLDYYILLLSVAIIAILMLLHIHLNKIVKELEITIRDSEKE